MRICRLIFLSMIVFMCGCREEILHDLSEIDANKLMSRLNLESFDATKERQSDGKWMLLLPKEQSIGAINYLSQNRLVKTETAAVVEKSNLMSSKEDQRFRYERALSREIEQTLLGINNVLEARVHCNLPLVDPVFGQIKENANSSASVLLVVADSSVSLSEVAALVAGASGVPLKNISVIVSQGTTAEKTAMASEAVSSSEAATPSGKVAPKYDSSWLGSLQKKIFFPGTSSQSQNLKEQNSGFWEEFFKEMTLSHWAWCALVAGLLISVFGVSRHLARE